MAGLPHAAAAKEKAGKKAGKKCKRHVGQCRSRFAELCGAEQLCLDAFLPCCQALSGCHAAAFIECAFSRN